MTKSWRPKEGWNNPFRGLPTHLSNAGEGVFEVIYEAGADAMLKALLKEGTHFDKDDWTDDATFQTDVPGNVVFIPDEEDK